MTADPDLAAMAGTVRPCRDADMDAVLRIVNAAAAAYRGVIPADRWHEPYMPAPELEAERAAGVAFSGLEVDGQLIGVMGLQHKGVVDLIRHAYVLPSHQGRGVGGALLAALRRDGSRPLLVGTWRAASWAIGFYRRHGFHEVPDGAVGPLLRRFWTVPERQVEASVVLSAPALTAADIADLVAALGS